MLEILLDTAAHDVRLAPRLVALYVRPDYPAIGVEGSWARGWKEHLVVALEVTVASDCSTVKITESEIETCGVT
jgi:hypothetical protein